MNVKTYFIGVAILILLVQIASPKSLKFEEIYCVYGNDCTLNNLFLTGNFSFVGDIINITILNQNVTGELNIGGNIDVDGNLSIADTITTDKILANDWSNASSYINDTSNVSLYVLTEVDPDSLHLTQDNWGGDGWINWVNPNFEFNQSKLAVTYYDATQAGAVAGTFDDSGGLNQTNHSDGKYDGNTFNFTEASGTPGLDLRINFTGIDDFSQGVMRYYTSALAGEFPIIQMWSYDKSEWEDYPKVAESISFATITQPVFDASDHIGTGAAAGVAQMRIYKATNGNTQNHYYIDWIAIAKGFGVPSGEEIDPFSIHTGDINYSQFNYDDGQLNLNKSYFGNYLTNGTDANFENLNVTQPDATAFADLPSPFRVIGGDGKDSDLSAYDAGDMNITTGDGGSDNSVTVTGGDAGDFIITLGEGGIGDPYGNDGRFIVYGDSQFNETLNLTEDICLNNKCIIDWNGTGVQNGTDANFYNLTVNNLTVNDKIIKSDGQIDYGYDNLLKSGTPSNYLALGSRNNLSSLGTDPTIAIGFDNSVFGDGIVIGTNSKSTSGGVALGSQAYSTGDIVSGVAIGWKANTGVLDGNIVIGPLASTVGGQSSVAIGYNSYASTQSISVGYNADSSGDSSTSIGYESIASGYFAGAFGANSVALGNYSTAIGYGANATGNGSIAIGTNVMNSEPNTVKIGSSKEGITEEGESPVYMNLETGDMNITGKFTSDSMLVRNPPAECTAGTYMTYTNMSTSICVAAAGFTNGSDISVNKLNVTEISMGDATSGEDIFIYFNDDSLQDEYIKWDDGSDRFEVSDELYLQGDIRTAGMVKSASDIFTYGAGDDLWLGDSTQANANFRAYATGQVDIDADNIKQFFGEGQDCSIYYDGTDMIINPKEVGTGILSVDGGLKTTGNVTISNGAFINITGGDGANATLHLNNSRIWNNGSGICVGSC